SLSALPCTRTALRCCISVSSSGSGVVSETDHRGIGPQAPLPPEMVKESGLYCPMATALALQRGEESETVLTESTNMRTIPKTFYPCNDERESLSCASPCWGMPAGCLRRRLALS